MLKATSFIAARAAGVLVVVALATAGFVTASSAGVSYAGARAGSQTFGDPVGDSAGAPDVTQVVIGDVAATGAISVAVTVTGIQPEASDVMVLMDADMSTSTGYAPVGADYMLSLSRDAAGMLWWDVMRWDGGNWQEVPQSATMGFSHAGDVYTWILGKADLGGTTAPGFTFFVGASNSDAGGNVTGIDLAPDHGNWSYLFSATPTAPAPATTPAPAAKPLIGAPMTTPAKAAAGKRFTVTFPVTRSDNGAPLTTGRMTCDPSVSGKVITHAESFTGGAAKLSFTVPKAAKGKVLKVKVTITSGNLSTTRIATFHIS
jgi:hypothetical protein